MRVLGWFHGYGHPMGQLEAQQTRASLKVGLTNFFSNKRHKDHWFYFMNLVLFYNLSN